MKNFKIEHHIEEGETGITITLIDKEGIIYHYTINKDDLNACDEGCNIEIFKK